MIDLEMQICSTHKVGRWVELRPLLDQNDKAAWTEAVEIFQRRMRERFLNCIELLVKVGEQDLAEERRTGRATYRSGFAVMTLCCVLIETLQAFHEGLIMEPPPEPEGKCSYPKGDCLKFPKPVETSEKCSWPEEGSCVKIPPTARSFEAFLKRSRFFEDFNSKLRNSFSQQIRNGLLHDSEIRGRWRLRMFQPWDRVVEKKDGLYILNRTNFYKALDSEFQDYLERLRNEAESVLRTNFLKKMDSICEYQPAVE